MGKIIILEKMEIMGLKIKELLINNGFRDTRVVENIRYFTAQSSDLIGADVVLLDIDDDPSWAKNFMFHMRKKSEYKNTSIILMSHTVDLKKIKELLAAGGDDFIMKPVEPNALLNKVRNAMVGRKIIIPTFQHVHVFDSGSTLYLEWTKSYEIGVKAIDVEHKYIIDNYNQFYQALKEDRGKEYYRKILEFLLEYVVIHFENEEKYQKSIQYPEYNAHKYLHQDFRNQIEILRMEKINKNITCRDSVQLCMMMKEWLIHHILMEDKKIGKYIQENDISMKKEKSIHNV